MASLIDTNILVYRFDPRDRRKQDVATELLQSGIAADALVLSHQSVVEFHAAVIRPRPDLGGAPLLSPAAALIETEDLLAQFPVLYPTRELVLTALRGAAAYGLSWFDAHQWAYAECHGLPEILSEDFEHGRHYGTVRAVNPFPATHRGIQELPALYAD